jgi:serine/threonine protein phosphatase PrpC
VTAGRPCPRCAAATATDDRFCEACGTDLRLQRDGTTAAVRDAAPSPCPSCGHRAGPSDDVDGWCPSCGLRRSDGSDRVETALDGGAAVSDRGHLRARNEDAVALGRGPSDGPAPVAAVVCDGVSSVRSSELAARAAADAALEHLLRAGADPLFARADGERRTRAAVAAGAAAAAGLVPPGTPDAPSCTLVCGLVDPTDPAAPVLTVGWVGDSRAYWLATGAGGPARLLTADHVAATAPPGMYDPVVVAARPDAITRWLGADGEADPEIVTLTPSGPGALLLCTDGLWKYFPDPAELAAVALPALRVGGPPAAAAALTAAALAAGGEDNVTVAVLPVVVAAVSPSTVTAAAAVPVVTRSSP